MTEKISRRVVLCGGLRIPVAGALGRIYHARSNGYRRRNRPYVDGYGTEKFVQTRVGLHHVCLRARERADVDEIHVFLKTIGAKIVHPPEDGPWAPGYYSVLFEDPDGIRLEVNHVPGKGLLA